MTQSEKLDVILRYLYERRNTRAHFGREISPDPIEGSELDRSSDLWSVTKALCMTISAQETEIEPLLLTKNCQGNRIAARG